MTSKVGTIGEFMRWTMTVVRQPERADEQPKRWVENEKIDSRAAVDSTTPETLVKLLSPPNLELLRLIASREFLSLRELAQVVGRKESNLSVTLKKLEQAGILRLETRGRNILPRLVASRVSLDIDLSGTLSSVSVTPVRSAA